MRVKSSVFAAGTLLTVSRVLEEMDLVTFRHCMWIIFTSDSQSVGRER